MKFASALALLLFAFVGSDAELQCLPGAHAHNDYLHERPLLDALKNGFCSVEADIHLVNGKLLVAHDADKVDPARTLEDLYLKPLKERALRKALRGPFSLMIDVKTAAEPTYEALREVLKQYADVLTVFTSTAVTTNAITVVISGNRAINTISNEPLRFAAIDGRLPDLETNPPRSLVPWISDNWTSHFTWRGQGAFPDAERKKLDAVVKQAHEQGRKIRFWGMPDDRRGWAVLQRAGVDLINTDNLSGLRAFLISENANY
ncbi:MAG TPA: phosphatidylinositol-specific phospholipase C/glycerophosphodiester phosphodiesterase family protein [Candidatus Binatia bacterium]|nr:phosphatidylinositol-specific phospholipase C/glycerophosphodiester phosphodiesterase family protein [Candidatus Binatia bacterium]